MLIFRYNNLLKSSNFVYNLGTILQLDPKRIEFSLILLWIIDLCSQKVEFGAFFP